MTNQRTYSRLLLHVFTPDENGNLTTKQCFWLFPSPVIRLSKGDLFHCCAEHHPDQDEDDPEHNPVLNRFEPDYFFISGVPHPWTETDPNIVLHVRAGETFDKRKKNGRPNSKIDRPARVRRRNTAAEDHFRIVRHSDLAARSGRGGGADTPIGAGPGLCMQFTSNQSSDGGFRLLRVAGTFNVENGAALATNTPAPFLVDVTLVSQGFCSSIPPTTP